MKTVIALSSQVVRGHVGLAAMVPALQALGITVWPMATVLLSNHPGHTYGAGQTVEALVLEEMADALEANGWLDEIDGVITGYLPTIDHVATARRLIGRLKREKDVFYLCDPVIGDAPKGLYVPREAADALRDELIELADILTPNAFELGWLAGEAIDGTADVIAAAERISPGQCVVATSVPAGEGRIANVIAKDGRGDAVEVASREGVPQGTGDLFAALLLGHVLLGNEPLDAVTDATEGVRVVIEASLGAGELRLVEQLGALARSQRSAAGGA